MRRLWATKTCWLGEGQFLEAVLVGGELGFTPGKFVEAEDVGEKIGGLRTRKRARGGGRHQFLDHVVEVKGRLALVFGEEVVSAERGVGTHAIERVTVTRCALRLVHGLAAMGLIGRV